MKTRRLINMEFLSRSSNEGFARAAAACFAAQLDPTLDEVGDIKTAVSEAVTNAIVHAYPDELGKVSVKARNLAGECAGAGRSRTGAAASRMWSRPGSRSSPPAAKSAAVWALPLWRALWTASVSAPVGKGTTVTMRKRHLGPGAPV